MEQTRYIYCSNNPLNMIDPTGLQGFGTPVCDARWEKNFEEQNGFKVTRKEHASRFVDKLGSSKSWKFTLGGLVTSMFGAKKTATKLLAAAAVEPTPLGEVAVGLYIAGSSLITAVEDSVASVNDDLVNEHINQQKDLTIQELESTNNDKDLQIDDLGSKLKSTQEENRQLKTENESLKESKTVVNNEN